jgi:hypothetical protein
MNSELKTIADKDYLHFLATTGSYKNIHQILLSKYSDDKEKLIQIIDWVNDCITHINNMNKKHGFEYHSDEILDKEFKIRKGIDGYHVGIIK